MKSRSNHASDGLSFSEWMLFAGGGALFMIAWWMYEAIGIYRTELPGLQIETSAAMTAAAHSVKALLPSLLLRVLGLYVFVGLGVGLLSAVIVRATHASKSALRTVLGMLFFLLLIAAFSAHALVERPALFEDVSWLQPSIGFSLKQHLHPNVAAAVFLGLAFLTLVALQRRSRRFRPHPFLISCAFVAFLEIPTTATTPKSDAHHPLVLWLGIDALRPDKVADLQAAKRTPNLVRFVSDATVFNNAYTPLAQTEPAWRALLTSRWPISNGVRYPLTPERFWTPLPTAADAFRAAGYQTIFETDCSRFNFQTELSGFEERNQPPRGALNFLLEKMRFRAIGVFGDNGFGSRWLPEFVDNRALAGIYSPRGYAKRLASTLIDRAAQGPLFFAFHDTATHFPGDPIYPYDLQEVREGAPLERRVRMDFVPADRPVTPTSHANTSWNQKDSEDLYDELLSQADMQMGVILDALKTSGAYDEALIVLFSDHGESFHEGIPGFEGITPVHGSRLREQENRIFLAIKLPASMKTHSIDQVSSLVRLIDIAPTSLQIMNLAAIPRADGTSLLPLINGQPVEKPNYLYAETGFTHISPSLFDPEHYAKAKRSSDSYDIDVHGVVSMNATVHAEVLKEKDVGAFDGKNWLIEQPMNNGTIREHCDGNCTALRTFLENTENGAKSND